MSKPPSDREIRDGWLWNLCQMYVAGNPKTTLEPNEMREICQRLIDLLPDPLFTADGKQRYWPTDQQMAAARVQTLVERFNMTRDEARSVVARDMNMPRAKVAQADRYYRGKKT